MPGATLTPCEKNGNRIGQTRSTRWVVPSRGSDPRPCTVGKEGDGRENKGGKVPPASPRKEESERCKRCGGTWHPAVKFTPHVNKTLQTNSNHAQNLLLQYMDEMDTGLAIVAKPYRIPPGNLNWIGSLDGSVAVVTRRTKTPIPCTKIEEGAGFVMVRWEGILIVRIYLSPKIRLADVKDRLDEISRKIRGSGSDNNQRKGL